MTDESTELPSGATLQEGQADVGVRQEGGASQNERREILIKKIVGKLTRCDVNKRLPNIMNRNIERFGRRPNEDDNAFSNWKGKTRGDTYTRVGEALAAYWDKTFPDDTALVDSDLQERIRRWLDFFLSEKTKNLDLPQSSKYFQELIEEYRKIYGENPFFLTALAHFALGDGLRTVISLRAALKAEGVETVGEEPIDNLTLDQILAGINEGPIKRNLELCLKVISEIRAAHPDMERVIVGAWITDPSGEKEPVTSLDTTLKQEGLVWNEGEKRYAPTPPTPSH
jgi:hypothetical protein